jgi:hypothetical protein
MIKTLTPARNPEAIIVALAGFCLIFFSAPAVGLSPDSITYTSAARNLFESGKPLEFDGQWLIDFPLGYPVFLGLILFVTRMDPFHFGLILNACLFGILMFVCMREMKKDGFRLFPRILYSLCLLFSTALLQVYSMLWSETLLILFVAFFFSACVKYGRTRETGALWQMAVVAALACITRYAGVVLLGMGFLLIMADGTVGWRKKVVRSFVFGGIGCLPLLANLVVNRINAGYLAGDRIINRIPIQEHLQRFGTAIFGWLPVLSKKGYPILAVVASCLLVSGSILVSIYLLGRKRSLYSWSGLGWLFTAVYSVFILMMALLTAFQPLDNRLLSPLWFPALAAAAGGARALVRRLRGLKWPRQLTIGMVFLAAILIPYPGLVREYHYLGRPDRVYQDHTRYDFRAFRQSPILRFIDAHPGLFHSDKPIYSNAGEVLYVVNSLQADYLPQLSDPADLEAFNSDSAYLIWLNDIHAYPQDYLDGLKKVSGLLPLYSFPDGVIYSTK